MASEVTCCNEERSFDRSSLKYATKSPEVVDNYTAVAYNAFLKAFPEYQLTSQLDDLYASDFSRLDRTGETYVDYMGGALYPESLIRRYTAFLNSNVLGNTHSVSNRYHISCSTRFFVIQHPHNSSKLSATCADEARAAVLSFFHAPPEYTVIFTGNATGALKLVGEAYPFTKQSTYILGADSHNSVHGIREFATRAEAKVCYIDSTETGGFVESTAKACTMPSIYAHLFD
jgi:selenocysteine lyase/cysteine desulfurase